MDRQYIQENKSDLINNYLNGYKELSFDYNKHNEYLIADIILVDRDSI